MDQRPVRVEHAGPELDRLPCLGLRVGELRVDSIRVVRRDTLYAGAAPMPVLVLEGTSGTQLWVDGASGAEVLSRGNAGPQRWWWHIRRGVKPPG